MNRVRAARLWLALGGLFSPPALAQSPGSAPTDAPPPRRSAFAVAGDGQLLPGTFAARIGDQRVIGVALGGYDSADSQGAVFSGLVEGAVWNRVALRVGYDYLGGQGTGNVSAGLRFGVLRQELQGLDLGVMVQYKQRGFTQSNGEIEIVLAGSRRWDRFGLFANLVYGQGFEQKERDGEVRVAGLYSLGERAHVGLEARSHFDLGEERGAARVPGSPPEAAFDLVAGPLVTVALGPVALLAEAGMHALVLDRNGVETESFGALALLGAGATF